MLHTEKLFAQEYILFDESRIPQFAFKYSLLLLACEINNRFELWALCLPPSSPVSLRHHKTHEKWHCCVAKTTRTLNVYCIPNRLHTHTQIDTQTFRWAILQAFILYHSIRWSVRYEMWSQAQANVTHSIYRKFTHCVHMKCMPTPENWTRSEENRIKVPKKVLMKKMCAAKNGWCWEAKVLNNLER